MTVQEISGGLLKRGLVDVVMDTQGTSQEIFTVSYVHKLITSVIFFAWGVVSFLISGAV